MDLQVKRKLLNAGLLMSSLIGYLEWGGNQHAFLLESEWQLLSKLFTDPVSVLHPLTVVPLVGQVLLLMTFWQKNPARVLTFVGMGSLGLLLLFVLLAGILGGNIKTVLSILPFFFFSGWIVKHERDVGTILKYGARKHQNLK